MWLKNSVFKIPTNASVVVIFIKNQYTSTSNYLKKI